MRPPPRSTLFPYTTLFRSYAARTGELVRRVAAQRDEVRYLPRVDAVRSEEHTSELQSLTKLVCRLLLEKNTRVRPLPQRQSSHLPDGRAGRGIVDPDRRAG